MSYPTENAPTRDLHILPAAERQRAEAIRHPRVRHHFVAGRVLLRQTLSRYASVEPRDWRFEETAAGRPEISAPNSATQLRFNLSHTDGLVACLVTETADCGVDVENSERTIDILGIASHSFGEEEVADLEELEPAERPEHFFALWTLKEAYLKALGSGIRLRLDAVRFALTPGGIIRPHVSSDDLAGHEEWQFSLFRPGPHHLLACAVRKGGAADFDVCSWELDSESNRERPIELPVAATTAPGGC